MKLFQIILLLWGSLSFGSDYYYGRIHKPTKSAALLMSQRGYDIAGYNPNEYIDLLLLPNEKAKLLAEGYQFENLVGESGIRYRAESCYYTYQKMVEELRYLSATYPDICQLDSFGGTWGKEYGQDSLWGKYEGYDHTIWAIKISDNVSQEEDEPNYAIFGGHHARELISTSVTMYQINKLVKEYATDPTIKELVDNRQIWYMPMVNPDGYTRAMEEYKKGYSPRWRKNIRDNNKNRKIDEGFMGIICPDGVDPNRNYGYKWGSAEKDPQKATYQGEKAFSEPETQAVKKLLDSRHFVGGISYHSYSELVIFPYGYAAGAIAPDFDAMNELAIAMAKTIPAEKQPSGHYKPSPITDLYPASGGTDDYAYGVGGTLFYTVELATKFAPEEHKVEKICSDNQKALELLLTRDTHATIRGVVTDSLTGKPIRAKVEVLEIDEKIGKSASERADYVSDITFGRYYRLLPKGEYTLRVSAENYKTRLFKNISVSNIEASHLDIKLYGDKVSLSEEKEATGNFSLHQSSSKIALQWKRAEDVKISLYNGLGQLLSQDIMAGKNRYTFHTNSLASGLYFLEVRGKTLLEQKKIFIK